MLPSSFRITSACVSANAPSITRSRSSSQRIRLNGGVGGGSGESAVGNDCLVVSYPLRRWRILPLGGDRLEGPPGMTCWRGTEKPVLREGVGRIPLFDI